MRFWRHYVENRAIKPHSRGRRGDVTRWTLNSCARHANSFSVTAKDVTQPDWPNYISNIASHGFVSIGWACFIYCNFNHHQKTDHSDITAADQQNIHCRLAWTERCEAMLRCWHDTLTTLTSLRWGVMTVNENWLNPWHAAPTFQSTTTHHHHNQSIKQQMIVGVNYFRNG